MLNILIAIQTSGPDNLLSLLKEHRVDTSDSNNSMLELVAQGSYHVVLCDGPAGIVKDIKGTDPRAEVIVVGGECRTDDVQVIQNGAFAFLPAPLDVQELLEIIAEIDEMFEDRSEVAVLEEQLDQKFVFAGVVGRSPKILDIISFVRRIAPYYKAITITGETGTGKEVMARALHSLSARPEDPFIASNCAGYVETLIESELFGHEKGSFTGAIKDKMGLFEAAREGTLFLDEIGDLPPSFQPHLLRVLQNGEFRPVGGHRVLKSKCRIIAATSKDLREEVRQGKFREDLFYRITPLAIEMPSLRQRKDDILLLSRFLLKRSNEQTGKSVQGISRAAQDILLSHDWPGNIRELENVIMQAVILAPGSFIDPSHFPAYLRGSKIKQVSAVESDSLDFVVKKHIQTVLEDCRGNRSKASKRLGISRRALLRKIEKYSIK